MTLFLGSDSGTGSILLFAHILLLNEISSKSMDIHFVNGMNGAKRKSEKIVRFRSGCVRWAEQALLYGLVWRVPASAKLLCTFVCALELARLLGNGQTVLKFFIILYWIALMGSISGFDDDHIHTGSSIWSSCSDFNWLFFLSWASGCCSLAVNFYPIDQMEASCVLDKKERKNLNIKCRSKRLKRKRFEFIFCLN